MNFFNFLHFKNYLNINYIFIRILKYFISQLQTKYFYLVTTFNYHFKNFIENKLYFINSLDISLWLMYQ